MAIAFTSRGLVLKGIMLSVQRVQLKRRAALPLRASVLPDRQEKHCSQ